MSPFLIIDKDLQLLAIEPGHAPALFDLVDNNREYLARWLPFPPLIKSVDDIAIFIEKSVESWRHGKALVCLIQYRGAAAGIISFNKILENLSKAEIGYWLDQSLQGQGIMTRACAAMLRYAFDELALSKVEIRAAANNLASRAVCERLGCQLEGIITQSENLHGQILDHAVYACHRA